MIKIDIEKYLQELEMLVNMDSGLGNPEGITAVGKYFADRLAEAGWICEQVDVGSETGKCTVVKNNTVCVLGCVCYLKGAFSYSDYTCIANLSAAFCIE